MMRKARLKLSSISYRDLAAVAVPGVLIIAGAFWLAALYIKPAPPSSLVMSTGAEEGGYHAAAQRYRDILARHGIELELRTSSGAVENLQRLKAPDGDVDVAFVQSGLEQGDEESGLVTLGAVYYEPVWVFHRGRDLLDRLNQLRGKRIAIGVPGGGTQKIARQLLDANRALEPPTVLREIGGIMAAQALRKGEVDAAILVGPPEVAAVRILLFEKDVRLMSFSRAPAYTRLFRSISTVTLPQGSIDLVHDVPFRDTQLLAPSATVVAREGTHPALLTLLLQAMTEVHGGRGVLQAAGEFPNIKTADFPVAGEAERFYKSGPSFLQRYLPFWAATLADRIVVMLVPLLAVLIPIMRITPPLYSWRIRSRIYRWYGELKFLEHEIREQFDPGRADEYRRRLDELETRANTRPMPLVFTDQVYTLRSHIQLVRGVLEQRMRSVPPDRPAAA